MNFAKHPKFIKDLASPVYCGEDDATQLIVETAVLAGIDANEELTTHDGDPVRIVAVDPGHTFPLVGEVIDLGADTTWFARWSASGVYASSSAAARAKHSLKPNCDPFEDEPASTMEVGRIDGMRFVGFDFPSISAPELNAAFMTGEAESLKTIQFDAGRTSASADGVIGNSVPFSISTVGAAIAVLDNGFNVKYAWPRRASAEITGDRTVATGRPTILAEPIPTAEAIPTQESDLAKRPPYAPGRATIESTLRCLADPTAMLAGDSAEVVTRAKEVIRHWSAVHFAHPNLRMERAANLPEVALEYAKKCGAEADAGNLTAPAAILAAVVPYVVAGRIVVTVPGLNRDDLPKIMLTAIGRVKRAPISIVINSTGTHPEEAGACA